MRDTELLQAYLREGSEAAFSDLVRRYIDMAYSVARRQLGDPALAQDVVQLTFCLLARKAPDLNGYESLAGWIHRTAFNISLKTLRDQCKRRARENAMAELHPPMVACSEEEGWQELLPLLDRAIEQLPDQDRTALALRFLQKKPMRDVGEALGTSEAAAKMRVGRAVEKVRRYFQKRGIACSSAALGAALLAVSADAAPVGLSTAVIAAALAKSGVATAGSITSTLFIMAKLKTKMILVGLGAIALFISGRYLADRSLTFFRRPLDESTQRPVDVAQAQRPVQTSAPTGLTDKMFARIRDLGLTRASAKLRAALNAPPRRGTRSYPSSAITDAIAAFGPYQDYAFQLLKEGLASDNLETRLQAIAALGLIGRNVPEARPLLWELLKSGEDRARSMALGALGNAGFLPQDLPTLAGLIPGQTDQELVRYLPEQIARAIQRDPAGTKPFLGPVEALLSHTDPTVRFSAACALAEVRGAKDAEILKGLTAGLAVSDAYRQRNEYTGEVVRHLMAIETLQRMGPDAKSAVPDLQAFVNATPDNVVREAALRAIGAIDAHAAQDQPEVRSILARDEERNTLLERLQAGTASTDDLAQGLREPSTASLAAAQLGNLGGAGKDFLPNLEKALGGKDEATRDEIVAAMRAIDRNYVVKRVSREPVAHGALAAQLELDRQRSANELSETAAKPLEKLIDTFRMGNTSWYTRAEVADFAAAVQKANPRVWEAFLSKAAQIDPEFEKGAAHD